MAYAAHCQQEAALDRWVFFSYFSSYGLFTYASSISAFQNFTYPLYFLGLASFFSVPCVFIFCFEDSHSQ